MLQKFQILQIFGPIAKPPPFPSKNTDQLKWSVYQPMVDPGGSPASTPSTTFTSSTWGLSALKFWAAPRMSWPSWRERPEGSWSSAPAEF